MATYSVIIDPVRGQHSAADIGLSPNLETYQINNFQAAAVKSNLVYESTTHTPKGQVAIHHAAQSVVADRTPKDLYYNRVHIIPGTVDVGNIASNQQKAVEVWNAHFTAKTLSEVTKVNLDAGVQLPAVTPRTFAPLESVNYNLTVFSAGAPQFNGRFDFSFDAGETPKLYVLGVRIIAFTFRHNWSSKVQEELSWLTKIYTSDNGHEQAVKHRSRPRRSLEFDYALVNSLQPTMNARVRARFRALLYGWQDQTFAVPIWTDAAALSTSLFAGTDIIPVDTRWRDYTVGSYVILLTDEFTFEMAEIESVTDSQIKMTRGLTKNWPLARTKVMPARLCRMSPAVDTNELTKAVETARIVWQMLVSEKSERRASAWIDPVYQGYPVWMRIPVSSDNSGSRFERRIIEMDFNLGYRTWAVKTQSPQESAPLRIVLKSREEIGRFFGWLNDRAGQLNPCWFPTWNFDLELTGLLAGQQTAMNVWESGYASYYLTKDSRRDIMIRRKNGAYYFRHITGAISNGDGIETLTIDSPLEADLRVQDVDRISFLRLASIDDKTNLTWLSTDKIELSLSTRDLLFKP